MTRRCRQDALDEFLLPIGRCRLGNGHWNRCEPPRLHRPAIFGEGW